MTSKEALERLVAQANARKLSNEIVVNRWDYEKLLELVERDTPMKVNSYAGSIFREYKCQCGQHFNSFYHLVEINFCPKCGQRIDWS
ncbi:MAG: hypothetical protein PHC31_05510 [Clostridia bacterium]|nr:hypothetical protein [Clostridia bacterium]MDD3971357.1 hypothetical protein [Clostridia bacterium]